jgi:3-deoxy-D-manno-oct-2-ulosonic acid (Kdo) hydroxylase
MANDVVLSLPVENWDGPFAPDIQAAALTALEAGRVIVLPRLPFILEEPERKFLSTSALDDTRKNISFDPATGVAHGTALAGEDMTRLVAMLNRFGEHAEMLMHGLVPRYAPMLERARTSFRPAEIAGRTVKPRKDDKRLHVDAFPTRPMRGRRILRVFTNIAPDGTPRAWRIGEPFPEFAAKFLPKLHFGMPGQAWIMSHLGLTKGLRAPYDFLMLSLHDAGKLDTAYQASAPATEITFPPGTTWLCFSDAVLHAATAGRYALEQTFHIPVEVMARPELAPVRILEGLAGRSLV